MGLDSHFSLDSYYGDIIIEIIHLSNLCWKGWIQNLGQEGKKGSCSVWRRAAGMHGARPGESEKPAESFSGRLTWVASWWLYAT